MTSAGSLCSSFFVGTPVSLNALGSDPSPPVTTAVILKWLEVMEKASSTSQDVTYLDGKTKDLGQWPAIAAEVRRAAQYHPKESIRRWAACGYLATVADVVTWIQTECRRPDPPDIDGDLYSKSSRRGCRRATWRVSTRDCPRRPGCIHAISHPISTRRSDTR